MMLIQWTLLEMLIIDLVVTDQVGQLTSVSYFLNSGSGTYFSLHVSILDSYPAYALDCGDFDGDGDEDLVVGVTTDSGATKQLLIFENNYPISFDLIEQFQLLRATKVRLLGFAPMMIFCLVQR